MERALVIHQADQFLYDYIPAVTSISPIHGPLSGGTAVTIVGTNFVNVTAVAFNSIPIPTSNYSVTDSSHITALSPGGSGGQSVDIQVATSSGFSTAVGGDKFLYDPIPIISSVSPTSGSGGGGNTVTINASAQSFQYATGVTFGTVPATSFIIVNSDQITAVAPAHAAGIIDIHVTNDSGTSLPSASDQYTYNSNPGVTSISPSIGPTGGGTSVIITGVNFTGVTGPTGVKFGSTNAASYTVNSPTQITAVSPAGTGTVDVRVTNSTGTSPTSSADQFTYSPAPTITTVNPVAGTINGGEIITITGTNFTGATAVTFGGTNALTFTLTIQRK